MGKASQSKFPGPDETERVSLRPTGRRLQLFFEGTWLYRICYIEGDGKPPKSLRCETRQGDGDFLWRGYARALAVIILLMRAGGSDGKVEPTIYGDKRRKRTGMGSAVSAFLDSYDQPTNSFNEKRLFPGNLTLVFYGSKHRDRKFPYRWVTLKYEWLTTDCIEIFLKRKNGPEEILDAPTIIGLARAIEQQEKWYPSQDADNWNRKEPAPVSIRAGKATRTVRASQVGAETTGGHMGEISVDAPLYVDPVDSPAKHGDMWRWNQRMFRSRHPGRFRDFDLVSLELGRSWWEKYPEQDWVLRDWTHEQIGQYTLCPISEAAFSALTSGSMKETDLSPRDIIGKDSISNHSFWYLASFLRAKVAPGIPAQIAEYCSQTMLQHILRRAVNSDHFATSQGKEVTVVAFVEARSLGPFAQKYRFVRSMPYPKKAGEEMVYQALWTRNQIEFMSSKTAFLQAPTAELIQSYMNQGGSLFRQPPHYD
jgi:hypothetical protein